MKGGNNHLVVGKVNEGNNVQKVIMATTRTKFHICNGVENNEMSRVFLLTYGLEKENR